LVYKMSDGDVHSGSSTNSDGNAMEARTSDHSGEEQTSVRRKRKIRGRGISRVRERSLTPTGEETRAHEEVVLSDASEKREKEDHGELPHHIQVKISTRQVPSVQDQDIQKTADVEAIKTNDLNGNESRDSDGVQSMVRMEEEAKGELLTPKDPRFVPKNTAFYMHDTGRSTATNKRTPFESEDKDEVSYKQGDVFKPTKSGK